jgi:ribosomal protein S18 acetylase RimI-like enzyme
MPPSVIQHRVDYQFLFRPAGPVLVPPGTGVMRKAEPADGNALFPLQEGYEKEEVLFETSDFQPLGSRLHLGKVLKSQEIVALWENGRPVAKAGTNALTAGWGQVGGVYTQPDHRGRGCQKRLMAFLMHRLASQGRGACLFVKTSNAPAIGLYHNLGFQFGGEFRITYGERRR